MTRHLSPAASLTACAAIVALALSACGSSSLSTPSASNKPTVAQTADPALVAKLPDKIKKAGKIVIGVDASYAPNEILDTDGKTVVGWDVDLFDAVMKKFGVQTTVWQPAQFNSIITGVQGGKYDIGVSSFTINPDRKKQINMVSYFSAGTQWATTAGNPKKVDPNQPCGLKVAVEKGTVQEEVDLPAKRAACAKAGNPLVPQTYDGQSLATAAVVTGKADAMLADSPIIAEAVKKSGGKIVAVGDVYDAAPYGYAVPKADTEFAQALADALKALNTSGDYKSVLTTWGVEAGAISSFAVNP